MGALGGPAIPEPDITRNEVAEGIITGPSCQPHTERYNTDLTLGIDALLLSGSVPRACNCPFQQTIKKVGQERVVCG